MTGQTVINGFTEDEYPFLNRIKCLRDFQPESSYGYPAILNANGYPTTAPAVNVFGVVALDPGYTGNWVVKWAGTGTLFLSPSSNPSTAGNVVIHSGGGFTSDVGFNCTIGGTNPRVVFSFAHPTTEVTLKFLATGTYSGMSGLVLCREGVDEAAIDAGEMINPDFVAALQDLNPRIVRTLDLTGASGAKIRAHADRRPLDYLNSGDWLPDAWVGDITGTNTYACSGNARTSGGPTDGAIVQGRIVNSNTSSTVTLAPSGWSAKPVVTEFIEDPANGALSMPIGWIAADGLATLIFDAALDKWVYIPGGLRRDHNIETLVALANAVQRDLWVTVSPHYSDADVAALVAYARDNLSPSLTLYLEFSNEVWNLAFGFSATYYAAARGAALGFSRSDNRHFHGFYGKRVREAMAAASTAWAPRTASQIRRVLAFQAYGDVTTANLYRLKGADLGAWGYDTAPNRPVDYGDVLSYATYFSGANANAFEWTLERVNAVAAKADDYASGNVPLMAAALDWLDADLRATTDQGIGQLNNTIYPAWEAVAAEHGKLIIPYEGGLEILAPTTSKLTELGIDTSYNAKIATFFTAYKRDFRCYKLVRDQFDQQMAQPHTEAVAWYLWGRGSIWSLKEGDLNSDYFQSGDAVRHYNNGIKRFRVS